MQHTFCVGVSLMLNVENRQLCADKHSSALDWMLSAAVRMERKHSPHEESTSKSS